jgi:Uma2 family endonuclease
MVDRTDSHAKHMTASEFAMLPETLTPTQLIDGVVIVSPSPEYIHQVLSANIFRVIDQLVSNGKVLFAPLDLYLDDENVFQPDVLWMREGGKCRVEGKFLHGAPALVVEILSPATQQYDKNHKFRIYEQHGVEEYWIVDPKTSRVSVWQSVEGRFEDVGGFGITDIFASPLLSADIHGQKVFAD